MEPKMKIPGRAILNAELTERVGVPVIKLDVVPIAAGDRFRIAFVSQSSEWRQGIWLGVDGELEINGQAADQMTIWTDHAPSTFGMVVRRTADRLLRLYNVWDKGFGKRESHSFTSGMLKEIDGDRTRYRCNDIGRDPKFDKLVFDLEHLAAR